MALFKHLRAFLILCALVAAVLAYEFYVRREQAPETIVVEKGNIVQQISVTGKAKAVQEVALAFQAGGTIASVQTRVGSRVTLGDVLAQLDVDEMRATLREVEATRDAEEAKLVDLTNGARPEDVAVYEAQLASSEVVSRDAAQTLSSALRAAYTTADDALHTKADRFIAENSGEYTLLIAPPDSQLVTAIENDRAGLDAQFLKWQSALMGSITLDAGTLALSSVRHVQSYLLALSQAANSPNLATNLSAANLASYRTDLSTARTNVENALASIESALATVRAAQADVDIARKSLESEKAGSTQSAIAAQSARVKQYEAQVANIVAQLSKANLISPITGVVTKQNAKVGQVAHAGEALVSVISDADLEIEAHVPEISIGKVEIGNAVTIVFDAYPEESFDGTVAAIEPAETIIDGVTNYKVTIALSRKDSRLRRGLTADLTIIRGERRGVIVLPEYVLEEEKGRSFVTLFTDQDEKRVPVVVGMRGTNGFVEVQGVAEGVRVIVPFDGEK